ncbi:MAG: type ISP restriction/modification enzyme [Halobacteriota archaeon]
MKPLLDHTLERSRPKVTTNFTQEFTQFINALYAGHHITPEYIMGYIYAILYSPAYREKYNEFLKIDFPRIYFTKDYEVFERLANLGLDLINLHLLKKKQQTTTIFEIQGSNVVKLVRYVEDKIYINKAQFFGGITEEVWKFHVGGYQVLDKWLKSRKGRELSSNEIEYFLQMVEVVKKTIEYTKEIDTFTPLNNHQISPRKSGS